MLSMFSSDKRAFGLHAMSLEDFERMLVVARLV